MKADDVMGVVNDLLTLAKLVVEAVQSGDAKKVEDVLPKTARTTLAKAAADARAKHKFG